MSWQELEQKAIQPYSCKAGAAGVAGMGLARGPAVRPVAASSGFGSHCPSVACLRCVCNPSLSSIHAAPAAFWQLSNRVYRGFGMSLIADTLQARVHVLCSLLWALSCPLLHETVVCRMIPFAACFQPRVLISSVPDPNVFSLGPPSRPQHVTNLSMPDPRTRTWLLRHWLLCLLDRSRRFNTGTRSCLVCFCCCMAPHARSSLQLLPSATHSCSHTCLLSSPHLSL